jgi:hypothetical protein
MGQPRIRDFFVFLTTLPASMLMAVCLFLPHTKGCNHRIETSFESGTWVTIVPLVIFGALPVAWRAFPQIRKSTPELVLAFTMILMAFAVILIPVGIWLMWGYSKRTFRGELIVAMCCTTVVALWLFLFPVITLFDRWLPAADLTWGAGIAMLVGMFIWTSAAISRRNAEDELHLQQLAFLRAV